MEELKKIALRLKEAIAMHNENKVEIKKELSAKLWPNGSEASRAINLSRMITGKQKSITIEQIEIICETLKVTPNYLFGYEN